LLSYNLCDLGLTLEILGKMYKLISSFATRNVAVFKSQYLLQYYTQRGESLTNYQVSQASLFKFLKSI